MEGTRNERVAILLVAYVIGFVTAYVAFGLTQLEERFVYMPVDNTASVINALEKKSDAPGIAAMTKEGLVLVKNNEARIISATQASADGILPEGYHTRIADYSLSPDGKHVYFCEVPGDALDICRPYTYSVAEDVVYPVKIDGQRVAFDPETQSAQWGTDGSITFE